MSDAIGMWGYVFSCAISLRENSFDCYKNLDFNA